MKKINSNKYRGVLHLFSLLLFTFIYQVEMEKGDDLDNSSHFKIMA